MYAVCLNGPGQFGMYEFTHTISVNTNSFSESNARNDYVIFDYGKFKWTALDIDNDML